MTAKEYLHKIKRQDHLINAKLGELYRLKQDRLYLSSPSLSERVISTSTGDTTQKTMEKIDFLENRINQEIDKLVDFKQEVREKINELSDEIQIAVLTEYYINGKTWDEIAQGYLYCERQIYRIHGEALQNFRKIFNMS